MRHFSGDGGGDEGSRTRPYRLREALLTQSEVSLYRVLTEIARGRYVIFAKVPLDEIIQVARPNENVHYFSKIFRKCVDFLLCDVDSLKPQVGIELVHAGAEADLRDADKFMAELFAAVRLPLAQIRMRDRFDESEIVSAIREAAVRLQERQDHGAAKSEDSVPLCPVCGKMMVLRTQRGGKAEGRLYYGCLDNPTCPGRVAAA